MYFYPTVRLETLSLKKKVLHADYKFRNIQAVIVKEMVHGSEHKISDNLASNLASSECLLVARGDVGQNTVRQHVW